MSYNDRIACAPAAANMKLSFVLPMYNEALNIEPMVAMIRREAAPLVEDYEIVIVDDASRDGCGDIADRMAREDPRLRVIHNPRNRGLGGSIRVGLAAARMPYVLYSDSDLPVDFACLRWVLPKVTPEVDLLIGYRVGRAEGIRRAIMSWTYNRLIRAVLGLRVRDVNFAFKLMRRDLLERLDLRSEGSFIDAEILLEARRAGATPVEVGLDYHVRRAGLSSLSSPMVVLGILAEMWRYLVRGDDGEHRAVIVNGDDFGLHPQVNRGILEAHRRGVLTSASVLAAGEAFEDAVAIAKQQPRLEVGIHLALTQMRPCAPPQQVPDLVDGGGRFPHDTAAVIRGIATGRIPGRQIEAEFRAQIERVRAAGLRISHLDSHQHVHMAPACARIVARLAREYAVPAVRLSREPLSWSCSPSPARALARFAMTIGLRIACWRSRPIFRRAGLAFPDRFFGFVNAGRMEREVAARLARAAPGVTEIGCHPGISNTQLDRATGWGYHWAQETKALCDDDARAALRRSGARLASWATCRAPRPRDPWARVVARNAIKAPLPVWFGVLALVVGAPADPIDNYASVVVLVAVIIGLLFGASSRGWRKLLWALSVAGTYLGLAVLANSALLAALVVPVMALLALGSFKAPGNGRRRSRRLTVATVIAVLLLLLGLQAKEEYREKRAAIEARRAPGMARRVTSLSARPGMALSSAVVMARDARRR